jgi:hypothetical protein
MEERKKEEKNKNWEEKNNWNDLLPLIIQYMCGRRLMVSGIMLSNGSWDRIYPF